MKAPTQKKGLLTLALAILLAVSLCLPTQPAYAGPLEDAGNAIASFFGFGEPAAQAATDEKTVVDNSTAGEWQKYLTDATDKHYTTENIGRIWTDKTVSDEDINLQPVNITIPKDNSDFLVMLSALSSTSNMATTTGRPLDVILVLDESGSMDETFGQSYVPVYGWAPGGDISFYGDYFVKKADGTYGTPAWVWDNFWQGEGHWELDGQRVDPKLSEDDTTNTQFYERRSITKMEALKIAAKSFINATAAVNDGTTGDSNDRPITDPAKQHRIAIVSYESSATRNLDFTAVTGAGANTLRTTVNNLNANGGTQSGAAMRKAADVMDGVDSRGETNIGARSNAQKVVLFFTDGEPGQSGWDPSVANDAITAAKGMKDKDTLVYTVGVMNNANPDNTTSEINGFMHGVSSNYPDATAWNNLGERAKDNEGNPTNYYKAATSSDELNNIFSEIAQETLNNATGSPTETDPNDPAHSGYLTFTDELGSYMKVDSFSTIVYANTEFNQVDKTTNGNTDTYTFKGETDSNGHYASANMQDIVIKVEHSTDVAKGDVVTVQVPATLIPLRNFKVDTTGGEDNTKLTVKENYPIRIAYGVSLKDDVDALLKKPDAAMQNYITNNTIANEGVAFYSNSYDKGAANGKTSAVFDPSITNDFYNFTTSTPLYEDPACLYRANGTINPDAPYYYQKPFYHMDGTTNEGTAQQLVETVELTPGTSVLNIENGKWVKSEANGDLYIEAGAPRLQRVNEYTYGEKTPNLTETASRVINPVWTTGGTAGYTQINVWLGNNGRITKDVPGTLTVSKNIVVPDGFNKDDYATEDFEFTITLRDKDGKPVEGTFDAVVTKDGKVQGNDPIPDFTFDANGQRKHSLKDGETLTIRGLADGVTYEVTENTPSHFQMDATGHTGNIASNTTANAVFTNTLQVTPKVLEKDAIKVKKNLEGRPWDADSFTFELRPVGDAPLPADAVGSGSTRHAEITVTDDAVKGFGEITFEKPGTYAYQVVEKTPAEGNRLPGLSYTQAMYQVVVEVVDAGKGVLSIDSVAMQQAKNDLGTANEPALPVADMTAVFKNTFDAESITANINGTKTYTDYSGKKPLKTGDFKFIVTPTNGGPVPDGEEAGKPFVVNHLDGTLTGTDTYTAGINYKPVKFTTADIRKTYIYEIREDVPADAVNQDVDGGAKLFKDATGDERALAGWTYKGVTYDTTLWAVSAEVITVNDPADPDKAILDVVWSVASSAGGGTKDTVSFSNSYTPSAVVIGDDEANIGGSKTLDGRNAKADETFDFAIAAANDATIKAVDAGVVSFDDKTGGTAASVAGAQNGVKMPFEFGDVTITKPGTYVFNVTESNIPAEANKDNNYTYNGMTYDSHACRVAIDVTDTDGVLSAKVTYGDGAAAAFVNTYRASQDYSTLANLFVSKTLNGRAMAAGEFEFTIEGTDVIHERVSNKAAGDGEAVGMEMLRGITFTQANAGNTYTCIIDEVDPADADKKPGVTYDQTQYELSILVEDMGDGTLKTTTTVTKLTKDADGNTVREPLGSYVIDKNGAQDIPDGLVAFVNTYKADSTTTDIPSVPLKKEVTGRNWGYTETFTFNVTKMLFNGSDASDALDKMPEIAPVRVSHDAATNNVAEFKIRNVTFEHAGTYVYTVIEQSGDDPNMDYSDNEAVMVVTVQDKTEEGKLEVTNATIYGSNTFTNSFSSTFNFSDAIDFQLSKTLYGHDMAQGKFKFKIAAADDGHSAAKIGLPVGQLSVNVPGAAGADGQKVTMPNGADIIFEHNVNKDADGNYLTDAGKTFEYTFSEVIPEDAINPAVAGDTTYAKATPEQQAKPGWTAGGYTYDSTVYTLTITPNMHYTGKWTIETLFTRTIGDVTEIITISSWDTVNDPAQKPAPADFVNHYNATGFLEGATNLAGKKEITSNGSPWPGDKADFEFKIEADANNPAPVTLPSNATSNADGDFAFGDITFTKPGTYKFVVSEVAGSTPGMTYSDAKFPVTVKVDDSGDGTLTAAVEGGAQTLTFTNAYTTIPAEIDAPITVTKAVTGRDGLDAFNFTMTADEDTQKLIAAGGIKDGKNEYKATTDKTPMLAAGATANFGTLEFIKAGTYVFTITEDEAQADKSTWPKGWTYDEHACTVTITVKDDQTDDNNKLVASVAYSTENGGGTFTNKFGASTNYGSEGGLKVAKTLEGRDLDLAGNQFEFKITADDLASDAKLTDADRAPFMNAALVDGKSEVAVLAGIEFDETDIGNTYTYTIAETDAGASGYTYDKHPVTIVIKVLEKDGDIYTETTVTKDGAELGTYSSADETTTAVAPFNNVYTASGSLTGDNLITVSKTLEGRAWMPQEAYTFKLEALTEKAPMPLDDQGKVVDALAIGKPGSGAVNTGTFGTIKFNQDHMDKAPYKEFSYRVTETTDSGDANMTYSKAEYQVVIGVTDKGDSTLTPFIKSINRVLNDSGVEDPDVMNPMVCSFANTYDPIDQPVKDVKGNNGNSGNGQMVGVGDELTYTINWENDAVDENGKAAPATITITDAVPAGTKYVEGSADNNGMNNDGTITWTIANAAANAKGTVSFKVTVTEDAATMVDPITNQASVQVGGNAPKQSTKTTNTVPKKAVIGDVDGTIRVGQELSYVINYRNDEAAPATITVTDKVPAGTTFVAGSAGEGVEPAADGTLTWTIKDVPAGTPGLVSFKVKVAESALGATDSITNQATVKIGDRDPGYKTNTTETAVKSGTLEIAKAVEVPADSGLTAPDKEFVVQVGLADVNGNALTGAYDYEVKNADGKAAQESFLFFFNRAVTGKISNGGEIALKAGQYVEIKGLPEGAQYTVTEPIDKMPAGFTQTGPNGDKPVTGAIAADGAAKVTVTNTYAVDALDYNGSENLKVTKTLLGRDWKTDETFNVMIKAVGYEGEGGFTDKTMPKPPADTISVGKDGAAFGDITFTKPGIYTYTVHEVKSNEEGMSYSDVTYTVTIEVTDNGEGKLEAKTSYSPNVGNNTMNFINAFQEKTVSGTGTDGTIQVGQELTYTIPYFNTEASDAKITITDTVPAGTELVSPKVNYDEATNTVTWVIENVEPGKGGEVAMVVRVTEDAVTSTDPITNRASIEIGDHSSDTTTTKTTLAKPDALTVSKTIDAGVGGVVDANKTFDFAVELKDASGKALTGTYCFEGTGVVANGANGKVELDSNGTVKLTLAHGQKVTFTDLPAGARYAVTEAPAAGYTATATGAAGVIDADTTVDNAALAAFTNTYNSAVTGDAITTDGLFTKVFTGRDWTKDDSFTFKITAAQGTPMPESTEVTINGENAVENADGNDELDFGFGKINFTFDDIKDVEPDGNGVRKKTFVYEVSEVIPTDGSALKNVKYDEHPAKLTITIVDDGKGNLSQEADGKANAPVLKSVKSVEGNVFTNRYETSLDYEKVSGGFWINKHLIDRAIYQGQFEFTVTPVDGVNTTAEEAAALSGIDVNGVTGKDYVTRASAHVPEEIGGEEVYVAGAGRLNLIHGPLTQDDAGKTFRWTISEVNPNIDGSHFLYDVKGVGTVTASIEVTDDGKGVLRAHAKVVDQNNKLLDELIVDSNSAPIADDETAPHVQVNFTNKYEYQPVVLNHDGGTSIVATKELTGRAPNTGEFNFKVIDVKGGVVATGTNAADGTIDFGDITYTTEKLDDDVAAGLSTVKQDGTSYAYTYTYTVFEDTTNLPAGVKNVDDSFNITVTVTDDPDSHMSVAVDYPNAANGLTFKNSYGEAEKDWVNMFGTKKYVTPGAEYLAPDIAGKYSFTLKGSDGAPMPGNTPVGDTLTVKNDKFGSVNFGVIEYTMANVFGQAGSGERSKTFTYTITEEGSVAGVDNDSVATKTVTVTLTDDGKGNLSVSGIGDGAKFTFTNEYSVDPVDSSLTGDGGFTIKKNLTGRDLPLQADEFSFLLSARDGAPLPNGASSITVKNAADGTVSIPAITFTKPGSYEYDLVEIPMAGVEDGITYDNTTYKAVAVVKENVAAGTQYGNGTLNVEWVVYKGIEDLDGKEITFNNTYAIVNPASVTLGAAKTLEGAELAEGQFTFRVLDEAGKVVAEAKNGADGQVSFPLTFDAKDTYNYTIVEVNDGQEGMTYDKAEFKVEVVVTDNNKGSLVASLNAVDGPAVFTNTYEAPVEPVKPTEPEPPALPKTGDGVGALAIGLAALAVAACAGLAAAVLGWRRRGAGARHTK